VPEDPSGLSEAHARDGPSQCLSPPTAVRLPDGRHRATIARHSSNPASTRALCCTLWLPTSGSAQVREEIPAQVLSSGLVDGGFVLPFGFATPAGCTDRQKGHHRSLESDRPRKESELIWLSATGFASPCLVGLGQGVRAAQGTSLPQASASQRHLLRTDYGGEQPGGFLEALPFCIYPAGSHVCASFSRISSSFNATGCSFFSPTTCVPAWLERRDCSACHRCITKPPLLIVPSLSLRRSLLRTRLIVTVLWSCPTRHRSTARFPCKVLRFTAQCPGAGECEEKVVPLSPRFQNCHFSSRVSSASSQRIPCTSTFSSWSLGLLHSVLLRT
jgi:hypothetical protein